MSDSEHHHEEEETSRFPTSTVTIAIVLAIIPLALAVGLSFWLLGSNDESDAVVADVSVETTSGGAPATPPAADANAVEDTLEVVEPEPAETQGEQADAAEAGEEGKGIGSLVEGMLSALDTVVAGDDAPTADPPASDEPAIGIVTDEQLASDPLYSRETETAAENLAPDVGDEQALAPSTDVTEGMSSQADTLASDLPESDLQESTVVDTEIQEATPELAGPSSASVTDMPSSSSDSLSSDTAETAEALPSTASEQAVDTLSSEPVQQQATVWNPISIRMTSNDGRSGIYKLNDKLQITVSLNKDGYLYCFYKDSKGQVFRIFPNEFSPEARRPARETVAIPSDDAGFEIVLDHLGDNEEVGCVAAEVDLLYTLPDDLKPDLAPLPVTDLSEMVHALSAADTLDIAESRLNITVRE